VYGHFLFRSTCAGQNLALNIADKGFDISVWNRSHDKTVATVQRAKDEKVKGRLVGFEQMSDFVQSLQKPRAVIMLVQAGKPVDAIIAQLTKLLEPGDLIIDGGNEMYTNTQRRQEEVAKLGLLYMGMGVSGGEEGARHGPSLMPGGPKVAYEMVKPILLKIAAQVDSGPCVTWIGEGGAGNYVKMIHNGIEYGDMQLIAEAYDVLKNVGGLTNEELAATFTEWNASELESFLIEITANIFRKRDEDGQSYIVDKILDKTGQKGTGRWTIQEAAELGIPCPTISAALDARNLSALLDERRVANKILAGPPASHGVDKAQLVKDVKGAVSISLEQNNPMHLFGKLLMFLVLWSVLLFSVQLYAAKICSYAQGMNLIRAAGAKNGWHLALGEIARIWKGGCIIRARFLDRIKSAYDRNGDIASLLIDAEFAREMNERQNSLRNVVILAVTRGISLGAFSASLAYFDTYRRDRLPANLTQAQRDYFGAHTYERTDKPGVFHTEWLQ
jgi:6-phosphogluconate dehydrogenase